MTAVPRYFLTIACVMALSAGAFGAPVNDDFANRIPLRSLAVSTTGSNVDATQEASEPAHWTSGGGHSVWWSWTAPASGAVTIDTFTSSFDTVLAVYTGNALASLTLVANNDDSGVNQSRVEFAAIQGTSYQIAVDGFRSNVGNVALNVQGSAAGSGRSLVVAGTDWKYLDNGSDQSTAWRGVGFDDSSWASGPAELGYGDFDEATVVSFGANAAEKYITTYFRHSFVAANVAEITSLTVRLIRDDGGVVYLNGQEVFRSHMPEGEITYVTFGDSGTGAVGGADETTFQETNGVPNLLVEGVNVLAVEMHQYNLTSSDISFNLALDGAIASGNLAPAVSILSPANSQTFPLGSSVTISADAYDTDGSISLVEFYRLDTKLGEDSSHPFSFMWASPQAGLNLIQAVATDNNGLSATSSVVNFTMTANTAPSVAITSPLNGATLAVPLDLAIDATATDDNGVASVEFYVGSTKLGEDTVSPYSFTWNTVVAGSYALTAVATDAFGMAATSSVVNLTVTGNYPPTVSITTPDDGAEFSSPANVTIDASASDLDGTVAKVEFFNGATKLGEDTSSPFSFSWNDVPIGNYRLTTVATDNHGGTSTSSPINVSVTYQPYVDIALVVSNSVWRYLDNGSDQGMDWRSTAFDDSGWTSGPAELGYGDDPNTVISYGSDAGNKYVTYYFRKSFNVTNAASFTNLAMNLFVDDGAIVYLNGTEVQREGMPADPIDYLTYAMAVSSNGDLYTTQVNPGLLLEGNNLLAVEVHQTSPTSSDVSFALDLTGTSLTTFSNDPPQVTMTSPTQGASFAVPVDLVITADATDDQGISKVEFFRGAAKLGEDTSAPYSLTVPNAVAGVYDLRATATDIFGLPQSSPVVTVTITGNYPPAVALTSPANNSSYSAPATITLDATASDIDGTITQVEFFNGATRLFEDTSSPYSFSWTGVTVGNYVLTAVATDNSGSLRTSSAVTVSVVPNVPPTVGITSPANNTGFIAPATITIDATASDIDGISKVEFFEGTSKLGEDTTSPYSYVWGGVLAGNYQLRTVAMDGVGLSATSAVVSVVVTNNNAPVVLITSPANNAVITAPADVNIQTIAMDADGIARVEFFQNGNKLGEDTSSPYNFIWSNPASGGHALSAVATDGVGLMATSPVVNISVVGSVSATNTLIAFGSTWKFLDDGSDQSNAWAAVAYDDSSWASGPAELGYGDGDETTLVSFGPDANNKYITTYFRYAFNLADVSAYSDLILSLNRDDGGVVFLNGVQVFRSDNFPDGPVLFNTTTLGSIPSEPTIDVLSIGVDSLVSGENIIAVEIHQATPTSSDLSFDLKLEGVFNNVPPTVFIASPVNNQSFTAPTDVLIEATANDADGSITRVEFYQNNGKLGEDTSSPYQWTWSNVTIGGSYPLYSVATDNLGARSTSAVVNVTIIGNFLPSVSLTEPAGNSVFIVPTNITLLATAADSDGSVANVAFYASGIKLGDDAASPFAFNWNNTFAGTFVLTAVATDNEGASVTSAPISVIFLDAPPPGTFITEGSAWRYLDDGSDQGIAWRDLGFDDSGWASGLGQLGYGDGDEATVLSYGPDQYDKFVTTYFRHIFALPDASIYRSLILRLMRDDGAVVYLNGTEIFRSNMPEGDVQYRTYASATVGSTEENSFSTGGSAPANLLVSGLNVVAVEIHQAQPTSSDISFDLELFGSTTNGLPVVALNAPQDNTVFTEPANIPIIASASDSDGSVTNVQFLAGATVLANDPLEPFSYTWQDVLAGSYALRAIATDDQGESRTSSVVNVFVVTSTAPSVLSFDPPAGTVSQLGQVTVNFTEPVDGVEAADLLVNGVPASSVTGANATYVFTFPQPGEGAVGVTWAPVSGIVDREDPPKPFPGTGPGETAQYNLVDTVAPTLVKIRPVPGATIQSLSEIKLTFSEAVGGVTASELRANGLPSSRVTGSQDGPFTYEFVPLKTNGPVLITWSANLGIHDFSAAQNAFVGSSWSYLVNTNEVQRGIVINEIMYHPSSQSTAEEYIELFNTNTTAVNLTGWTLSSGVSFTFTNAAIPAGGYLVVAANVAAFQAKYPGVVNVIGGWVGQLSNTDDNLNLNDAEGNRVDSVHYADEGDWATRIRGLNSSISPRNHLGWDWYTEADGLGRSLELINFRQPNQHGQNWRASLMPEGTPGAANSVASANIAPLILDVSHFPAVPTDTEPVTVIARILDESINGLTVILSNRNATTTSPPDFTGAAMFDDGNHNDGAFGDGIYGAILPAMPDGAIMEFFVWASDATGNARTWPAAARQSDQVSFAQTCNAIYQVDNEAYTGGQPIYRLIMTTTERDQIFALNSTAPADNHEMNATFVSVDSAQTRVRYNISIRHRGAGSRGYNPPNYRVRFPSNRRYDGRTDINLNTLYTHSQLAGSVFTRKAGLTAEEALAIQARVNSENRASANVPQLGSFIHLEDLNSDFAANQFPLDPNGNVYKCVRPNTSLSYLGTDPQSYINAGYSKQSNSSENDWSDLINLTYVLNNTPDDQYTAAVRQVLNVEQWIRYLAVMQMVGYNETAIGSNGDPDDYSMYRGVKDPRFLIFTHDHDTDFGEGNTPCPVNRDLFYPTLRNAVMDKLMKWPEFTPLFYGELKRMSETVFAPEQFNPELDRILGNWVPPNIVERMKTWMSDRRNYVLSRIPLSLTVETSLGQQDGYFRATSPIVNLTGVANVLKTRAVTVNGALVNWVGWQGAWSGDATLQPGINRVTAQALDVNGLVVDRVAIDIWYDDETVVNVSGNVTGNTLWTAANGPYAVAANVTVPGGSSLTIEPGTTIYFTQGAMISVAGQLLAQGTPDQRIRMTRQPGSAATWGGLQFNDTQADNRLMYVDMDYASTGDPIVADNSRLLVDSVIWTGTTRTIIDLNNASVIIRNSVFPTIDNNETIHGVGMPANGYVIIEGNYFGGTTGYSDIIDFTGGQRPGPILQVLNNTFNGGSDDALDLDGTDAHIEGNSFLHIHQDASRDSGSYAIATDANTELVVVRNLFYDNDHAMLLKNGASAVFDNNTVALIRTNSFSSYPAAVISFGEPNRAGVTGGAGATLDGNVLWEVEGDRHFLYVTNGVMSLTVDHSLLSGTNHPGLGNLSANPLFVNNTNDWRLAAGSPARGTGPNGLDMGAYVPAGATISGEPLSPTPMTSATLTIGGPGITHYQYRLNNGNFSVETPVVTPISLSGLSDGVQTVRVVGKNSAGVWQETADATVSKTWVVNGTASGLWLNEILARNVQAVEIGGRYPDLIELYNSGSAPVDLAGMSLSDNKDEPKKFVFPPGATLGAGKYLILYADTEVTPPGWHLGFSLRHEGDDLYLFAASGKLLDSVQFGLQLADFSIGRLIDGRWGLSVPAFGDPNMAMPTGDPRSLWLNEWLAVGDGALNDDFIELYNSSPLPVELSGMFLTDNPMTAPIRHELVPLSFIAGYGYLPLIADGNTGSGANHIDFRLGAEQGLIGLFAADQSLIDCVYYGPQIPNVSMGRSPNGSLNIANFPVPTPGSPNPAPTGPGGTQIVINEVLAKNASLADYDGIARDWIEIYNATPSVVNLSDLSLTDDSLNPRRWVFPPGVNLASGGFLVVRFEGGEPVSTTSGPFLNTGFGINANGETVFLYDKLANGGSLLDAVNYGVQAADFSIGRIPDGGTNWVLTQATTNSANLAVSLGNVSQVKINEWMADPSSGDDWFELFNPNSQPVNLSGFYLTDNLGDPQKHPIAPLSFLGTDLYGFERFVADNNVSAGAEHVNFKLSASGESIGLYANASTPIDVITFGPQAEEVSQGRLPDGAAQVVSFPTTPTPGDANYLPLASLVINEVMSHSDWPYEDAIELHNPSGSPVDISGWYLSDAKRNLKKYQIPVGTVIPSGGYKVFYESNSFFADPVSPFSFSLNSARGDEVYVSAAVNNDLTGYRAVEDFGAAENNVSFGRYTNSVANVHFVAMSRQSFGVDTPDTVPEFETGAGKANAYPRIGPLVINEIMYHPPDLLGADNTRDEFIELYNMSGTSVTLYDPAFPTNTWRLRDAVRFDFPMGVEIPPSDFLLVVSFDPVNDPAALAQFRAQYGIPANVAIHGPYSGKLDNGGEPVELYKPDAPEPPGDPDAGYVPYVLVERVKYSDAAPWPNTGADGGGFSLHRIDPLEYGNDPGNWREDAPSPGPGGSGEIDSDGDGMPDSYESQYPELNPLVNDAYEDADSDGMFNIDEYRAGTEVNNPQSNLNARITVSGTVSIEFQAIAGRDYVVEYKDTLGAGAWLELGRITQPATGPQEVPDSAPDDTRFYRVRLLSNP